MYFLIVWNSLIYQAISEHNAGIPYLSSDSTAQKNSRLFILNSVYLLKNIFFEEVYESQKTSQFWQFAP